MKTKISLLVIITLFTFKSYSQTTDSSAKPAVKTIDSIPKAGAQTKDSIVHPPMPDKALTLPKGAVQVTPDKMLWTVAPETLPKGTLMCVLYGDPKAAGPFVIRFKIPANQVIKLHTHPKDEMVTVIEGSVMAGFGDRIQLSKSTTFTAGSFYVNPANTKHYVAVEKDGATLQINGTGPWTIDFK
ncbi:MAG TPA: cupin domain-containing protein [Bacteroidia bacterium]|nr:cupin domain-containing protein [Bacteroidia bacterium]